VDASRAERIGLYHRVVPVERVVAEATSLARRLAQGPSLALAVTKDSLNREAGMNMLTAFDHEGRIQAACMQSPNFREAHDAFRAKREPRFR
jgi:enoyl-CoA hydratase/carnithine racemase